MYVATVLLVLTQIRLLFDASHNDSVEDIYMYMEVVLCRFNSYIFTHYEMKSIFIIVQ